MDLELAPGRYPLLLSDRWILVALAPVPWVIVLGLFLDASSRSSSTTRWTCSATSAPRL